MTVELTRFSEELSQREIPKAFASDHVIFPSQAAVDALSNSSWLSLWNAQTMSRNRSRSLRADWFGAAPFAIAPFIVDARRLMM